MAKKLKCIVLPADGMGRIEEIENKLEPLQKVVGGLIQYAPLSIRNSGVICNEEGLILNLPYNLFIPPHELFGTIIIVRNHNGNWTSLREDDILYWKSYLFNRGRWASEMKKGD